jgi:hypothetical protein
MSSASEEAVEKRISSSPLEDNLKACPYLFFSRISSENQLADSELGVFFAAATDESDSYFFLLWTTLALDIR